MLLRSQEKWRQSEGLCQDLYVCREERALIVFRTKSPCGSHADWGKETIGIEEVDNMRIYDVFQDFA